MNVEQYDSPLRFLVSSETEPEGKHLVDLGENGLVGKCACQHFSFRAQPTIDQAAGFADREAIIQAEAPRLRCKHLVAAREFFTNRVVRVFVMGQSGCEEIDRNPNSWVKPPCTTT